MFMGPDFWVPEPDGRGTWKVIYSCLTTLTLCIFTALHLNVGPDREPTYRWWTRKLKWVMIGVISPEVVLYAAGKQWFAASMLCKKLNKWVIIDEEPASTLEVTPFWSRAPTEAPSRAAPLRPRTVKPYGMLYGHYAVMGGFVVDVSHIHNSLSRLTISPKGIAFLAKYGHFLKISDYTIHDKSKQDLLAKLLVLVQVSWILTQTIARRVLDYPITLLELHTLIHVAIAIGMYGLWFRKPMDVRDPTWVDTSAFQDLIALMLVRNFRFGAHFACEGQDEWVAIQSTEYSFKVESESAYLHYYRDGEKEDQSEARRSSDMGISIAPVAYHDPTRQYWQTPAPKVVTHQPQEGYDYNLKSPYHAPAVCSLLSGQALDGGVGPALEARSTGPSSSGHTNNGRIQISLSDRDVRRWNLAAQALRRVGEPLHLDSSKSSVNYFTFSAPNIFLDRKGVQAGFYAYFCAWASGGLIAALCICVFYGAAHTSAWNFEFPTATEQLLWRIACIDIMGGVVTMLALFSFAVFLHEHDFRALRSALLAREPGIMPYMYRAVIFVGVLNLPLFLLSRFYIIAETFASLRNVSAGVYKTIDWAEYIPHL